MDPRFREDDRKNVRNDGGQTPPYLSSPHALLSSSRKRGSALWIPDQVGDDKRHEDDRKNVRNDGENVRNDVWMLGATIERQQKSPAFAGLTGPLTGPYVDNSRYSIPKSDNVKMTWRRVGGTIPNPLRIRYVVDV